MTNIYFGTELNKQQIRITGHAGYDVAGKDIVCAAISALCQSYAFYVEKLVDNQLAGISLLKMADGDFDIICHSSCLEAKVAYEITRQGLESLAEAYPENVKIFSGKIEKN